MMEVPSAYEIIKYGEIIKNIENEGGQHKQLMEQLEESKAHLRFHEVLVSDARDKLFQVRVKVFSSLMRLLNVHRKQVSDENIQLLAKKDDANLFLIEVYMAHAVYESLLSTEWLINFTVKSADQRVNANHCFRPWERVANPITTILPLRRTSAHDEVVIVNIGSCWRQIRVAEIHADISYKFHSVDASAPWPWPCPSLENGGGGDGEATAKEPLRRCKMRYYTSHQGFIEMLARNGYHGISLAHIVSNEGNLVAKLDINGQRVQLAFDVTNQRLSIEASTNELHHLKRYFTNECCKSAMPSQVCRMDVEAMKNTVPVLQAMRKDLRYVLTYDRISVHNVLNVYDAYNRFAESRPL